MKGRVAIVSGIAIAGLGFTVWLDGISNLLQLFDFGAFVLAIILPVLVTGVLHGFTGFGIALGAALDPKAERPALTRSKAFLSTFSAYLAGFASIGFMLGMTSVFINIDDRTKLGSMLAIMSYSLLYAALVFVVFVVPLAGAIRAKLAQAEKE